MESPTSILAAYRGWRLSASALGSEDKLVVVDDLSSIECATPRYNSLREVEADFIELLPSLGHLPIEFRQASEEKLKNSLSYIKQLKGESPPDMESYLSRGSLAIEISEDDLLREHRDHSQIEQGKAYKTTVAEIAAIASAIAKDFAEILPLDNVPEFSVMTGTSSVPFAMVVTCDRGPINLEVCNLDYRSREDLINLLIHEVGHIVHLSELRKNSTLQREAPHLLAMSMHTQECYYLEFVAQYLHQVYLDSVPGQDSLRNSFDSFNLMNGVTYKNLMDLLQKKKTTEAAAEFHAEFETGDKLHLQKRYEVIASHSFGIAQVGSYYSSFLAAKKFHRLKEDTTKKLSRVLSEYQTPNTILGLVE